MTMNEEDFSAGFAPDPNEAMPEEAPSEVTALEEAPEVEAAPVNDDPYGLKALADQQREVLKAQQEQLARQNAPQAPSAPRPLMEQDEWVARYDEASENAGWDANARTTLRRMNQELANEAAQGIEARVRGEMQATFAADTVAATLRTEARSQFGDLVDDDTLAAVRRQVFTNPDGSYNRAMEGQALQDPSVRRLVMEAAAGRRMLAGKTAPPTAPARPTPPPAVQSSARNTQPGRNAADMWSDPKYLEDAFADGWSNPEKYAKGGNK